jgi:hypothetical protein
MRSDCRAVWASVAIATGTMTIAACGQQAPNETVENETSNEQNSRPPLPIAEPPMNRSAVLQAVAKAASAAALGRDDATEQRSLDGDRFEVRIRFGCAVAGGAAAPARGPFNVRFDEKERTLRLRATPDLDHSDANVAALGGEAVEAVEGFWMYRPWLLEAGCPATPVPRTSRDEAASASGKQAAEPTSTKEADTQSQTPAPAAASQRVGIAQFYTETDSRVGRRDRRAYEATKVLPEDGQPSRSGYDLVLSGRLEPVAGGKIINCRVRAPNSPPECIVSAQFDRVRIETPGTKEIVAEWSN